jgi:biotin operon repressor
MNKGTVHRLKDTFGKAPIGLLLDENLTDGAVRLYCYMHWRYGSNRRNFESLESMAQALGVSETTIGNRAQQLEQHDWIIIIRRGSTSNFYHVFESPQACRTWRTEHERKKPKRNVKRRKSRAGMGGNPNLNLSSFRHVPNSSSEHEMNSSSAYPDSVIQTQKDSEADASQGRAVEPQAMPVFTRGDKVLYLNTDALFIKYTAKRCEILYEVDGNLAKKHVTPGKLVPRMHPNPQLDSKIEEIIAGQGTGSSCRLLSKSVFVDGQNPFWNVVARLGHWLLWSELTPAQKTKDLRSKIIAALTALDDLDKEKPITPKELEATYKFFKRQHPDATPPRKDKLATWLMEYRRQFKPLVVVDTSAVVPGLTNLSNRQGK